jgi:hypothetical protein
VRIKKAAKLVAALALSLGWFVPVWLGCSEIQDGMGRRRPFTDDEWAYVLGCVYFARAWFLLAAGVWVVLAARAVIRRFVKQGKEQAAASGRMA